MTRALVAMLLVACSAGEPGAGIDVDRALAHARALVAIGPRAGESEGAKRAAEYVEQQLRGARRADVGTVDLPAIVVLGRSYRTAHRTHTTDVNVVGRYGPPSGKALLLMAHYDSVRGSPGAIDNAAAVGVLLELARVLDAEPPRMPVIVALTAREEDGLIGAEALASQIGDQVDLAIALDLIGGDGDLILNGAGTLIGEAEMQWLADAADRAGVVLRAPLAHRVISRWWPQAERSDHGAFARRGIRAVHFYHRGHDGELIDRAYHSRYDVFDRIERASVDEVGRLVHAIVASPPPPHDGDGFWIPQLANLVVPRWPLVAFELALAAFAIAMLVRMRVERARGGAGLVAGGALLVLGYAVVFVVERAARGEHPSHALHAPAYHVLAEALLLAGVVGLASRLVARFAPWRGARRYLAVTVIVSLVLGVFLLAIGAAELAWIWLVPAACAAAAPFVGRLRVAALAPTLLPAVLLLDPDRLREAAWNGFAPPALGLAGWLALVAIAPVTATVYALRDRAHSGPLGTLVVPVGWALATTLGLLMLLRYDPPCSASQFHEFFLRCEIIRGV